MSIEAKARKEVRNSVLRLTACEYAFSLLKFVLGPFVGLSDEALL
jgi:hypothetical protein